MVGRGASTGTRIRTTAWQEIATLLHSLVETGAIGTSLGDSFHARKEESNVLVLMLWSFCHSSTGLRYVLVRWGGYPLLSSRWKHRGRWKFNATDPSSLFELPLDENWGLAQRSLHWRRWWAAHFLTLAWLQRRRCRLLLVVLDRLYVGSGCAARLLAHTHFVRHCPN